MQEVQFQSEGATVSGHLYVPENASQVSAILLCHGFTGVKELLLPTFAERFCQQGYAALIFDYRGFGQYRSLGGTRPEPQDRWLTAGFIVTSISRTARDPENAVQRSPGL